jgi:hypothetical protein
VCRRRVYGQVLVVRDEVRMFSKEEREPRRSIQERCPELVGNESRHRTVRLQR